MKKFLVMVLMGMLVVGCEGPVGPEGPQGPRGPAGQDGAPSNIRVYTGVTTNPQNITNIIATESENGAWFSFNLPTTPSPRNASILYCGINYWVHDAGDMRLYTITFPNITINNANYFVMATAEGLPYSLFNIIANDGTILQRDYTVIVQYN